MSNTSRSARAELFDKTLLGRVEQTIKSSSQTTVKEVYKSTDLPDEYCYHFTEDEVEEFVPSCPINLSTVIHRTVVVPGEYCYPFTESEIEDEQALIECFNYLDEMIDF